MKKFINYLSGFFLASLLALGLATIGSYKANDQLVVRDVLSQDVTKDVTGKKVRKENAAVETKGLVSEVKAQVSEPVEDKISIRFVAGIDSYLYNTAKFDIKVEDANKNFEGKVTTAYTAIEVGSGVLSAQEVFGTEYNYLIAFTINGVPSEFWGSTFEVTASIQENEESEVFTSNVSYKVINDMIDADSSTVLVFDAEDLKEIANNVNNNIDSYAGKTVKLMKDIDLNNELWTPIGTKGDLQGFKGDFDGNNKTISNLKIDQTATPASLSAGLFGSANGGVIKNFTIDGADIKSVTTGSATTNGTAVVVGSSQFGLTIENVDVKNANVEGNRYVGIISGYFKGTITGSDVEDATITARPDLFTGSYDNGDKAGTIIGYSNGAIKLANNTVTDVEITGYRDLGGIAGMASRTILENNTVTNLVINVDQITGNMGERTPTADAFVGRYSANEELGAGNTSSNVTINVWTPSKTVLINNLDELKAFRDDVNNGNTYAGKTVVLTNNIDLGNEEWTPIGNSTNKFQGDFDGQNYTVSNLKVTSGKSDIGFFGFTSNGHISNLTIKNAEIKGYLDVAVVAGTPYTTSYENITVTGLVKVDGFAYVGGAFGKNAYANMTNITVNVEPGSYVKADSISNGSFYRTYVGGVIGFMGEGTHEVKNVSSNIDVYGTVCDIGGIVGIAHEGNKFTNIVSTGNVYLEGSSPDAVDYLEIGGIAGVWMNNGRNVTLTDCVFTGEIIVTSTAEVELPTSFKYGGLVGKTYYETGNGKLILDGVDLTDETKVFLFNKADLEAFRDDVNNGNTYAGKTVVLLADIDLGNEEWTPIGSSTNTFQGNFDGQNHTVSNLKVTANPSLSNIGFFGFTTNGHISNLTIENAEIKGRLNVGVIAGTPYTTSYENITITGLVKVDGMSYVGGAFGKNVYANITGITINAAEGSYVKANSVENGTAYRTYVGGVAGFMGEGNHEVKDVVSNIDVYGTTCDVGGIVGIAHYGNKFTNIVSTGNVYLTNASKTSASANEIGGIAGVWHNQNDTSVTLTNVSFTGELSITYADGTTYEGSFANDGLVGTEYTLGATGKLIVDGVQVNNVKEINIYNVGQLKKLATLVNEGNALSGTTVYLMNNIDLGNEEWTPIGNSTNKFQGNFDGQNHTISNLKITSGNDYVGLFGYTTNGHISNLTIENAEVKGRVGVGALSGCPYTTSYSNITLKGLVKVDGMSYVGSVLGRNAYANITNITVEVEDGSYVRANSFENDLLYRTYVGGVIGFMGEGNHKVSNVVSNIDVYGNVCDIGGIVGIAHYGNTLENITATGNVYLEGLSTDAVDYLEIGGIAGVWMNSTSSVTLTNCEFTGEIIVTSTAEVELPTEFYYGGLVGKPYSATGTGTLIIDGYNLSDADVTYIYTKSDLEAFRDDVNNGNTYAGKTVVLMNNIDLGNEEWTPIGNSTNQFQGDFDGLNHTVSNLKVTSGKSDIGFFGFTSNGHISNLTIKNAEIKGYLDVAVVAGTPYTTSYENITVTGLVKVDGFAYVGGAFGKNAYANMTNITINVEEGSYVKADSISNGSFYRTYVGGVIGFMGEGNHEVKNVSSNIDVYGTVCDIGGIVGIAHYGNKLTNVVSTGNVYLEGSSPDAVDYLEIGGIAGVWMNSTSSVTLTNCEFTGEIIVTSTVEVELPTEFYYGGLVGKPYSASGTGVLVIDGVEFTA